MGRNQSSRWLTQPYGFLRLICNIFVPLRHAALTVPSVPVQKRAIAGVGQQGGVRPLLPVWGLRPRLERAKEQSGRTS
jgi:hypothetical protein